MDIVITLPVSLWKKVVSGEKSIELRKSFPKEFDVNKDRVYVILKGTKLIVGYWNVIRFEAFYAESINDFNPILYNISVPKQWIINYVGYSSMVYLWHIGDVVQFDKPINREYYWKMQTNPQSFIYLR